MLTFWGVIFTTILRTLYNVRLMLKHSELDCVSFFCYSAVQKLDGVVHGTRTTWPYMLFSKDNTKGTNSSKNVCLMYVFCVCLFCLHSCRG